MAERRPRMLHRQRDRRYSLERDNRGGSLLTATSTTSSGPVNTYRGVVVAAIRSAAAAAGALAALMAISTCVAAVDAAGSGDHPFSLSKLAMKRNAGGTTVAGTVSVTQVVEEAVAASCISRHDRTSFAVSSWPRVRRICDQEEGMREGFQVRADAGW